MSGPLFPAVTVNLSDSDGNAFAIIGRVTKALRRGGAPAESIEAFRKEAMSGDYDNVLQTCFRYVDVE